jgi:glycosyltransferase involved in cell wall biosynthesis
MKVAIVHEWLVNYAGSERVLEQMIACFPDCDLYSVVDFIPAGERKFLQEKLSKSTFIQKLPFSSKWFRQYLALMPLAIEQLDVSSYDLVISSSHAVAKGVITGPDQLHICMCYSPVRYAWDLQHQYLEEAGLSSGLRSVVARWMLHNLRIWDVRTANGVDEFIAISKFIARRIEHVYRRRSEIVYPPVDIDGFELKKEKDDFYVTVSRMVPYKRIDLIVEAFSRMPQRKLVVIGTGTERIRRQGDASPNIQILGEQPFDVVGDYISRAKAFVFAAEEDFGIAPVEAQACGTPVIAYGKGGSLETIAGSPQSARNRTGVFFQSQTVESLIEAVLEFEALPEPIRPEACRVNAEKFSIPRFREEFKSFVTAAFDQWRAKRELNANS